MARPRVRHRAPRLRQLRLRQTSISTSCCAQTLSQRNEPARLRIRAPNSAAFLRQNFFQSGGNVAADDRAYVAKVVANRTGLTQPDAEKRVNDVLTKAKTDLDAARKAAAQLAFWLTASLLIGAFCASLAATEGGALRDGTWRKRNG